MLKSMKKLAAIAAVTLVAGPAFAVPMTWNYSGTCSVGDCSAVPSITGTLSGNSASYGNPNELGQLFYIGEVSSYTFNIGGSTYSGSNALGSYNLDAAGNIIGGAMQFFGNFFQLDLSVGAFSWTFSDDKPGYRYDIDASGYGSYTKATQVPEPALLSVLGIGLLGFSLMRRRKA